MERATADKDQILISALAALLPDAKKKTLKERIAQGAVTVNGEVVRKATHRVQPGDEVALGTATAAPGKTRLPVIFADEALYVVDKPAGVLSVAGGGERDKTAHARASADARVPLEIVHRLDRETSGLLVFATTKADRAVITRGWERAQKTYLAWVEGAPAETEGTIALPLWEHPKSLVVHVLRSRDEKEGARDAVTHYRVEKLAGANALLRVRIETGRKHQIRAHLAQLGCPIVGDDRYGEKAKGGLMLHAATLELEHPRTQKPIELSAPLPARFVRFARDNHAA